ncbi:AAA family ATPase [Mycoplasma iguanae]|uniref:AAA family ATPase n=1 Tax=Mycoplasma iguanae TaxID=292461 RepID=A0ABY5R7Z1_9MOLU|nr:AAA family ATPase [Mycoplasma iguanae]UVD81623.1 AAA family ATPase [Mycoplasma iguanae]
MKELTGKFIKFIFRNETTNFFVGLFRIDKEYRHDPEIISLSSNSNVQLDVKYKVIIEENKLTKYPNSYILQNFHEILPDDKIGLINYFASSKFPGIGKKTAETIVEDLGIRTIEIIKENPDVLDKSKYKLNKQRKLTIIDVLNSNDQEIELVKLFQANNLPADLMKKIIEKVGVKKFYDFYYQNPFDMWIDHEFINFEETNKLAKVLNFSEIDREKYFVLNQLNLYLWNIGSTKVSINAFFNKLIYVHLIEKSRFGQVLKELIDLDLVLVFQTFLTTTNFYSKEKAIVKVLKTVQAKNTKNFKNISISTYFDNKQSKAIKGALNSGVSIITGQPGTGKTEILKEILKQLEKKYNKNDIAVLAPTGRATFQIANKTSFPSRTVHSFLGWQETRFKVNADNPEKVNILIVDEFSMIDTNLFHALLNGIKIKELDKIILIGDKDQIPSIGEGYLLNDFISSEKFPVFLLKNNYRQKNGSNIFADANKVNQGLFPDFIGEDSKFLQLQEHQFFSKLNKIFDDFYKKYSIEDITILVPMYETPIGINSINSFIQSKIFESEKKTFYMIGNRKFYIGDKVIQLENDLNSNIFNGEIGYIENIVIYKNKIDFIIVKFPGDKLVKYTVPQWNKNVTLAYAISIHKFQGSESPVVIMVIFNSHSVLLNKKLIYTGMTRAKEYLVILGDQRSLQFAISKDSDSDRKTNIQDLFLENN